MAAHGGGPYVSARGQGVHRTAPRKAGAAWLFWLFLIFIGVPILEIALFVEIGGAIGLLPTLGIILLTAITRGGADALAGDAGAGPAAGEPGDRRRTRAGRSRTAR